MIMLYMQTSYNHVTQYIQQHTVLLTPMDLYTIYMSVLFCF